MSTFYLCRSACVVEGVQYGENQIVLVQDEDPWVDVGDRIDADSVHVFVDHENRKATEATRNE